MTNVQQLVANGRQKLIKAAKELESTKQGVLRAGNTGIMLKDGTITGKCHNLTLLRFLGIDLEENDYSKELMFEAGRTNEDSFLKALQESWKGPILREEEAQIRWLTVNGTEVTGRPDIVLAKKTPVQFTNVGVGFIDVPKHVVELKLVSSVWTALKVMQGEPKLAHVIQAAHYGWQLSVDATLFYTNRTNFALPSWANKNVNFSNPLLEGKLNLNEKTGDIKAVLPFEQAFKIEIDKDADGTVFVTSLNSKGEEVERKQTIVSKQAIANYYNFISSQLETDSLGPIPQNLDVYGEKENYSMAQYCPAGSKCCMGRKEREGKLKEWIQDVSKKD